ncbi:MAG: exo-alpha-sialidase [Gemmatimonadetes bacterium]|nr:exo-alpha-sialidase [Gemmatimonadota bacterium]
MQLTINACAYEPGELKHYSLIRAGEGWDYHQGPILYAFAEDRLMTTWGAYDIQECSNDGVVLYSESHDHGETWQTPQVFIGAPNSVVSHLQFARLEGSDEALVVYREGHYYGAREDRKRKTSVGWANYAESPMSMLVRRSLDAGTTWLPPQAIDTDIVVGHHTPPYYGSPEQLVQLASGALVLLVVYMDPNRRDPQHFNISFLRSEDGGRAWTKTCDVTVPDARGAMEPSVAEVAPGSLFGVVRNKSGSLYQLRSDDDGGHWQIEPTDIPTVESMARVLRLRSGRLLLVWNNESSPTQLPRHPLAAAVSDDEGHSWGPPKVLADEVGANQLSNFNLLQAADGRILVCTSHYRAQTPACSDLDMLVFDETWLLA